jgi:HK97 gp10 family phage protein
MDSIKFDITGINKLLQDLGSLDAKIKKNVKDAVNESALKIQSEAKKKAPVNLGILRGAIYLKETSDTQKFVYTVGVDAAKASYAPYIEFGTGGKVSIPNGYADYAMKFKGKKGGKFIDMVKALAEWVAKKGITGTYSVKTQRRTGSKSSQNNQNMSAAYAIAISILRKGLRPQPFLIPSFETEKPKLVKKIKEAIKDAKP